MINVSSMTDFGSYCPRTSFGERTFYMIWVIELFPLTETVG